MRSVTSRRHVLEVIAQAALAATLIPAARAAPGQEPGQELKVFLSPTCGCCKEWIARLEQAGFQVEAREVANINQRKAALRVPPAAWSCHTGVIGGYFIEGHVPPEDIRRLLAEKPAASGLAVPGMPVGSPGMEVPGQPADRFDTMLVAGDGSLKVWASH